MDTPMQHRIELSVTSGLGYDSRTDFIKSNSLYADFLSAKSAKNTPEGLNAHLREITGPEFKTYGTCFGHLFSSNGRRIDITAISGFRGSLMHRKNQKLVDKAYGAEAKRRGRTKIIANGLVRNIFGKDINVLIDSMKFLPLS